jgi:hypothetical protein
LQAFSGHIERRAAQGQQTEVGPGGRLLWDKFGYTQQLLFGNDLYASLYRR